jgi:hypothetical protein
MLIADFIVDDNNDCDHFCWKEIPVLVWTDVLDITFGIVVDPLRRIDLAGAFIIPAGFRAVCRSWICRRGGGRDTLIPGGDDTGRTRVAGCDSGVWRSAIVDGSILRYPLGINVRIDNVFVIIRTSLRLCDGRRGRFALTFGGCGRCSRRLC